MDTRRDRRTQDSRDDSSGAGGGTTANSTKPRAPQCASTSPLGRSLRHVSPRKFHQLQQQQRAAVLRALPLSPLLARVEGGGITNAPREQQEEKTAVYEPREPVPWNPAWLPTAPGATRSDTKAVETLLRAAGALGASSATRVGTMTLDAWLQSYEQEFLVYESLEHFVRVKLPEALAFCEKMAEQSRSRRPDEQHGPAATSDNEQQQQLPSSRFHVRLRIAVFAHLVERTVFALSQSAALSHAKKPLFQARQEIFRAMFADYDKRQPGEEAGGGEDDSFGSRPRRRRRSANGSRPGKDDDDNDDDGNDSDSNGSGRKEHSDEDSSAAGDDVREKSAPSRAASRSQHTKATDRYTSTLYGPTAAPRTLAFFIAKVPFALKLGEDTQRRELRFQRNQVVLRRIVQSLYRSLGSVFHAWKLLVRQKKDERLSSKGAQLTAMVVQQRGLVRSVFVEWSKATLRSRIQEIRSSELARRQQHEQVVADLHKEIFLLRERNRELQLELAESQCYRPVSRKLRSPASPAVELVPPTTATTSSEAVEGEATPTATEGDAEPTS